MASDGHEYRGNNWSIDSNNLISYANNEYRTNGLNYFFANGDMIDGNDTLASGTAAMVNLRDNYFSRLLMPYHYNIGNHELNKGAVNNQSFYKVWGYGSDSTIVNENFVFVFLNITGRNDFNCSNPQYLENTLDANPTKKCFVIIHASQVQSTGAGNGVINATFNNIINSHTNVMAVISGHDHWTNICLKNYTNCYQCWDGALNSDVTILGSGCRMFECYDDGQILTYEYDLTTNEVKNLNIIQPINSSIISNE